MFLLPGHMITILNSLSFQNDSKQLMGRGNLLRASTGWNCAYRFPSWYSSWQLLGAVTRAFWRRVRRTEFETRRKRITLICRTWVSVNVLLMCSWKLFKDLNCFNLFVFSRPRDYLPLSVSIKYFRIYLYSTKSQTLRIHGQASYMSNWSSFLQFYE